MAGRRNLNVREDLILDILLGNGDDSDLEAISDDEADTSALRKEVSEQILALLGEGVEGNVPSYDQEEGEGDAAINGEEEEEDTVAGGIGDDEVNAEGGGDDEVNAEEVGDDEVNAEEVGDDEVNAEEVGDDEVNAEGGGDDEVNAEGGGNRVHIPGGGGDQGDKVTSSKKKGKPTQKRGRKRKVTASNKNNKKSAKKSKTTKKKKSRPNWEEGKFISKVLSLDIDGDLEMPESSTPLQYFKEYFPDEFFERTANFTNMYCLSKFGKELNTNAAEIKKVFGMHLLMGCLKYPRLRMYWSAGYGLEAIQKAMPRDRFFLLRNCLHVVDVNNPPAIRDRLWKVQPVLDAVKNGCDKIERQPGNYSIDEQMVPFLGRTTLRQYVPNKPRPVGLKNFVITTSEGIMIDFFLYQGSQTNLPTKQELGLGPSVVMRLKDSAPPLSVLYFDRYFTSVSLMKKLLEEQYFATGTMITNRLQNIKFTQPTMMRGDFEERISPDNNLVALKWMDNKPVVILSSVCGSGPVTPVLRWSKQSKTFENVDCPAAIVTYNKNMGGVDTLNQLIEAYRTWFKTRKWTLKVILHFLDLVVVNCWLLYRRNSRLRKEPKKNVMDLLMFRLSIAEALKDCPTGQEEVNGEEVVEPVNPKPQNWRAPLPGTDKRRDGFNHWPVTDTLSTARACRYSDCTSRTRVRCEKCNVYLCLTKDKNCFKSFHTS